MEEKTTDMLENILKQSGPERIGDYLKENEKYLIANENYFSAYLRGLISGNGLTQHAVFEAAGLPDRYGYRILTQEKHTKQRDYILRLCFGARISLPETQRALKLYGMSELYAKIPRDAALMIAFNRGIYNIDNVNKLLKEHNMDILKPISHSE